MLIYKFLNKKYGLLALKRRRLKVSRISELNDPFELLVPDLSDPVERFAFKKWKADLSNDVGLLCFSKYRTNPLLWSHYADDHKGLCLGFEVPGESLQKVRYTSKRPNAKKFLYGNKKTRAAEIEKMIATKYIHWKYETEMRMWDGLQNKDPKSDIYVKEFSPELKLTQVVVGAKANISRSEVRQALGGGNVGVQQFRVRAAFTTFKIIRNRDESIWKEL